jgi:tellurite resistance protein
MLMSLGLLVGRFGAFLREQPPQQVDWGAEMPFPDQLDRLREQFGHHIVLLMLLSRSDGEAVVQERDVILRHCLDQARKGGGPATTSEAAELGDYLRELRPIFAQFEPAIRRLEDCSKDEVIAVVAAAIAVVDADGARRPREVEFLTELKRELHAL